MNITLIGFMASGKTSFGKYLAERYRRLFFDIDEEIVKDQLSSIREIFSVNGEGYFRELESRFLKELILGNDSCIVATGGGIVEESANREFFKKYEGRNKVIFLRTNIESVLFFTRDDRSRPLLEGKSAEQIQEMIERRNPLYEELADLEIDLTQESYKDAAEIVFNNYFSN